MIILTLRTDKPEAEIGLFKDGTELVYKKWTAHRQLAETLHSQIAKILQSVGVDWGDIKGVVVFKGPGSFTGLRIGLSVANALAYSYGLPIVGTQGKDWLKDGLAKLQKGQNDQMVLPKYGSPVYTTPPKK